MKVLNLTGVGVTNANIYIYLQASTRSCPATIMVQWNFYPQLSKGKTVLLLGVPSFFNWIHDVARSRRTKSTHTRWLQIFCEIFMFTPIWGEGFQFVFKCSVENHPVDLNKDWDTQNRHMHPYFMYSWASCGSIPWDAPKDVHGAFHFMASCWENIPDNHLKVQTIQGADTKHHSRFTTKCM